MYGLIIAGALKGVFHYFQYNFDISSEKIGTKKQRKSERESEIKNKKERKKERKNHLNILLFIIWCSV